MRALDLDVFADIKLHDIPTTVGRAARVLGRLGVSLPELPRRRAVSRCCAPASKVSPKARATRGHDAPVPIAVTVLTSDPDARAFDERLARAIEAGCGGVVCSVQEIERVHARASRLRHDRSRCAIRRRRACTIRRASARPSASRRAGGDVLVVGRAVTASRRSARGGAAGVRRGCERAHGRLARERRARASRRASCGAAQSRYAASLLIREVPTRPGSHVRITPSRRRSNMANPPTLTPEQRQLALEKAGVARRQRAEVKDKLKIGSLTSRASCSTRPTAATSRATCSPS